MSNGKRSRLAAALQRSSILLIAALLSAYRALVSPLLGPCCRFVPSCSVYAEQAVQRYGPLRGGWRAVRRLLRCHPLHPGGWDPVR
jgi:putative membrane protein insertion efficiency factor